MEKRKVLIVDDDAGVRESLRMVLKELYEPRLTNSGEEALTVLPDFRPDLVLLDVLMPGLDGLEVLERLKRTGPAHTRDHAHRHEDRERRSRR
jgi:CheY-like chemotaxis protein